MTAAARAPNSLTRAYRHLRMLGMRSLILTIAAMAVLNITILTVISRSSPDFDARLTGPPLVRQAAAAARLMDTLPPEARTVALAAMNSPSLRLSLNPDFSTTPPVENPTEVFVPIIAAYAATLGDRPFSVYSRSANPSWMWPTATLADDLIVVMRLADGSGLVIESGEQFRRLVSLYGVAFVVGVLSLVLIGLMIWASLSYAGPLARLANASKSFVEGADGTTGLTPLPEVGPRPVRDLAVALNLAGSQLVRLTIERTNTLAAVAHDLRTYLTRLRMRSEFIEDDGLREKTVRDIEDMAQLLEDTLLLGKRVTRAPDRERIELIGWLVAFVARRIELGEPVVFLPTRQEVGLDIATPELARILNNLVDNALRYAGSAQIRLDAGDPDSLAIEVLDDGPGVPESFLEQMSEPYTRLEGSRSRDTGGAGLGLAITSALVEQIGGALKFSNRKEGGFCARVALPRGAVVGRSTA